ncbi:protein masquerade-like [Paramacrobiotus metropolitanus]|uniref:protein masquerade-like n=1 Tax=Paramacrobiotus metropolitanus TaxID=2943436 RepID=UPI002445FF50|nr:protein masquerade-like [Paramacrobiotus metropolitanus]
MHYVLFILCLLNFAHDSHSRFRQKIPREQWDALLNQFTFGTESGVSVNRLHNGLRFIPEKTTQRATIPKACGIPGGTHSDPFELSSQFTRPGRDAAADRERRSIGGTETSASVVCWQAFVVIDQGNGTEVMCGGVIIGSRTILTTGTCLFNYLRNSAFNASAYTVIVGAVDSNAPTSNRQDPTGCAQTYTVESVLLHPGYVFATDDNDIGILTLSSAIDLANKPCACSICLTNRVPAFNETCVMSGYGVENNGNSYPKAFTLKWIRQKIIPQSNSCVRFCLENTCTNISNFLCSQGALGQDECWGDNGGPLACYDPTRNNYYLAGLIAFGTETCGKNLNVGGQSVKIEQYLSWIIDNALPGDVQVEDVVG